MEGLQGPTSKSQKSCDAMQGVIACVLPRYGNRYSTFKEGAYQGFDLYSGLRAFLSSFSQCALRPLQCHPPGCLRCHGSRLTFTDRRRGEAQRGMRCNDTTISPSQEEDALTSRIAACVPGRRPVSLRPLPLSASVISSASSGNPFIMRHLNAVSCRIRINPQAQLFIIKLITRGPWIWNRKPIRTHRKIGPRAPSGEPHRPCNSPKRNLEAPLREKIIEKLEISNTRTPLPRARVPV